MKKPIDILKQYWGYENFRPLQLEIINASLNGNDTLALLPTGGGKSICYQVPALCFETGITLVISPLIALMKDQVENLKKRGIQAEAIYSGQHYREMERILDNAQNNYIKFLYLSPERLSTDLFKIRLFQMQINLVAIDEAHCVSQWGYDFRPSYLKIKELRETLKDITFIALTATATPRVKTDIVDKLGLQLCHKFQKSFKRDNLSYSVLYQENKLNKLLHIFNNVKGTGLVYVRSRKKTTEIAHFLKRNNISADFYHAGLPANARDEKQRAWMNDETRVIVCTNAFGMGIDKPNVRMVVHIELPDSIEAYFQEAGRAGRDGKKAYATLLYQPIDKKRLLDNLNNAFPAEKVIKKVYNSLCNYLQIAIGSGKGVSFPFHLQHYTKHYNLKPLEVYYALNILQAEEYIHLSDSYFEPSKFKILLNRKQLYNFQIKFQQYNPLIKTILRSMDGSMDEFVKINEQSLAFKLKISKAKIIEQLTLLQKNKVVSYIPQHDQPMITFITERLAPENIGFNNSNLAFRKEVQTNNVTSIIQYVEDKINCRSQQLLAYFGEEKSEKCKCCDVCLGRNKTNANEKNEQPIRVSIQNLLHQTPMTINELINAMGHFRKEEISNTLRKMIDEKVIHKRENNTFEVRINK